MTRRPTRIVNAVAPIRICDNGGWTDTWFARSGKVCNIAVLPGAEVQVAVYTKQDRPDITVHAVNYDEEFTLAGYGDIVDRHRLLVAAIESAGLPEGLALDVWVYSEVPAGCSTGTSAAVTVAILGALDRLTPGRLTADELASAAHRVEVDRLKLQSGIQDQLSSAHGGISFIEMYEYPHATVSPVVLVEDVWLELERRLVLVFLGRSHDSGAVHQRVIATLEQEGEGSQELASLRQTATRARDALLQGNFGALGRAMADNTEAQAHLHHDLVGTAAREVISLARRYGAVGWKVNGAGGDGGSLTLLCGAVGEDKRRLLRAITKADPKFRPIPIRLSRRGLRTWESPA